MSNQDRREVFEQLRRVVAWEMEAQVGVERAVEDMPTLMADNLLDFFEGALKPGARLPDRA